MTDEIIAAYDQPLQAVLLRRKEMVETDHPDMRMVDSLILKDGPRAHKVATHWVIVDRHTKEVHHHAVRLSTYTRLKAGWVVEDEHSVTIDDAKADEITALATFLATVKNVAIPEGPGDYIVVPVTREHVADGSIRQLLGVLSANGKAEVLAQSLAAVQGDPEALQALVQSALADPQASMRAAAALKAASVLQTRQKLEELIEANAREGDFQTLLTDNPWIFGSEYSELLDRRNWTRDEQHDFVLRRTVDGYLEIIEIQTPLEGKPLFLVDRSHGTLYPRSELSSVLAQVMQYLEELDAHRFGIQSKDAEDVCKIRAKIIIGRDGDADQVAALRRWNGHLHRVEVLTFDQLVRIAHQVTLSLEHVMTSGGGAETAG